MFCLAGVCGETQNALLQEEWALKRNGQTHVRCYTEQVSLGKQFKFSEAPYALWTIKVKMC